MSDVIWYRSTAAVSVPAYEDRGTLTILPGGGIRFAGRYRTFTGTVTAVGRTRMGSNKWVYVQYETDGKSRTAFFMDGGALGWSGILGGNSRLARRLNDANPRR